MVANSSDKWEYEGADEDGDDGDVLVDGLALIPRYQRLTMIYIWLWFCERLDP